jgi:hypothetical protein
MHKLLASCALALSIALVSPTSAACPPKPRDMCAGWYSQISAQVGEAMATYDLHAMGCHAPWGAWVRDNANACTRYAYHVSRHEFDFERIGQHGCVLFEDGSWGVE